jgi:hypothetical protein
MHIKSYAYQAGFREGDRFPLDTIAEAEGASPVDGIAFDESHYLRSLLFVPDKLAKLDTVAILQL